MCDWRESQGLALLQSHFISNKFRSDFNCVPYKKASQSYTRPSQNSNVVLHSNQEKMNILSPKMFSGQNTARSSLSVQ